ncbi:MAG: hypothetical protein H7X92_01665 [Chitinophagales bacterium]|nr:hypothetical protein [Hyphomicrobiales bacterium]
MLFADAPLTNRAIGHYISAKIATKRRTLKQLPHAVKEIKGERFSIATLEHMVAVSESANRMVLDEEVTAAIKLEIYEGFFTDLAILDEKAGALASVIAIITGFIVFLAEDYKTTVLPTLIAVALGAAMLALLLTISVLTVRWATTAQLGDRTLERMLVSICRVRNWRTIRFRVALYLAFSALVFLSTHIVQTRILPV